jgi:hypothetical protein
VLESKRQPRVWVLRLVRPKHALCPADQAADWSRDLLPTLGLVPTLRRIHSPTGTRVRTSPLPAGLDCHAHDSDRWSQKREPALHP